MSEAIVNVTESYNTYSQPQLAAIDLSISFIHQAIDALDIDNSLLNNLLIIADFDTSHAVASGHSFYEQCLPNNSLSIGYSSTSIQCTYRLYEFFLKNRSYELIPDGILILVIPCLNEQGQSEELYNYTIPSYIRSYNECVDEKLFNQYSLQLIKVELHNSTINFYEQLQIKQITLEEFAQNRTEFMCPWCESILKIALEMNKQRLKEEINQLLNQY
ncbi:unnamed protein product [Rotaria sp. Silwood1]|nr:unnamed protein product [Rotaria sp. Silwood1]CAF5058047.1 unnamed protein product [Rotaria sp. Silwood1]